MRKQSRAVSSSALAVFLLAGTFSPLLNAQVPSPPVKAVIITGQNYHPWKITSEALKQMLENTGLFQADIVASPPAKADMKAFRPDFAAYGLVVLDYSGDDWPVSTQKAFVSYVKNGGGVVVYHSANNTFPKWPEYNEIIGLAGWGERTDKAGPYIYWKDGGVVRDAGPGICGFHGPEHPFLVINRDSSHPITAGLPERWMHGSDELYGLLRGPAQNLTVLATAYFAPEQTGTGRHEPVLFTVNYGAGRIFHTVLGHARPEGAQPALECVGFIVTFQRGAEWAATGKVTQKIPADFPSTSRETSTPEDVRRWPGFHPPSLDAILEDLDGFAYSRNEDVLYRLREYVLNNRGNEASRAACEDQLLAFIRSTSNPAARLTACRELRLIGSERSVAVLSPMLQQAQTTDPARYALEKIPGPAADRALLEALKTAPGDVRLGIISSLGARKTGAAVEELASLLSDPEQSVVSAAAAALGQVGGKEAVAALSSAFEESQGETRARIASSLLGCADGLLSSGDRTSADLLFEKIIRSEPSVVPAVLRQAALRGKIRGAERDAARSLILETLTRGPQEMHQPAISQVPAVFKEGDLGPLLTLLPKLPEASQVQLLTVLTAFPGDAGRPSVLAAVKSSSMDVRIAAVKALAKVGDHTTVPLLAERAAASRGSEQLAARASLAALPGEDADAAVVFWLSASPSDAVKNELIQAAGARRVWAAKSHLKALAGSGSPANVLEAAKALRTIASAGDVPDLLAILFGLEDEQAQEEMESTIGVLAQKTGDPYSRAQSVEALLAPDQDPKMQPVTETAKRCLLYRTLGKIGDDSSLWLLRGALEDDDPKVQDAAIRALSDWPSPTPREEVLGIAQKSTDLTHQVLALRGYIRMVGLEKYQSPETAVRSLKAALDLAARPDEKKLVLGVLPEFAGPDALALAESMLVVEGVREEAQAAVDKIKENLAERL